MAVGRVYFSLVPSLLYSSTLKFMDSLTFKPTSYFSTSINSSPKKIRFLNFPSLIKLKTISPICFSCKNPHNPKPTHRNGASYLTPLLIFIPILQRVKRKAYSQTKKWVSRLQEYREESEKAVTDYNGDYLRSGSIGVALLSVTTNAKVRFSPFVSTLAANPSFVSGLVAWFVAQSVKVILNFFVERKWDLRLMFASGGMPSSHSALCTALTTSVAICHGVADCLFPVCLGFSLVVMYDAIGVRRHAGMQAQVLNIIVEDLFEGHPISQRKLKELLGHTPSQVVAGAMLGILVACYCCQLA